MAVGLTPPNKIQAYLGNPREEFALARDLARHGYPATAVELLRKIYWITEEHPYSPPTPAVEPNKERDGVIIDLFQTYGGMEVIDGELYWIVRDRQRK